MSHISDAVQGACSDDDCFGLVIPPTESTTYGFRFDLEAR